MRNAIVLGLALLAAGCGSPEAPQSGKPSAPTSPANSQVRPAAFLAPESAENAENAETPTDADGFTPLFDDRTLQGWHAPDMSFWTVEDGAITATITPEHSPRLNQYLVWQGGMIDDFELKLEFRLTGSTTRATNGGFQFRSRLLPNGDVAGYQVDNNFGRPWRVRLYDEYGRHDLALEGERTEFDRQGRRHVSPIELSPQACDFRLDEWHEYHLVARGRTLSLSINGHLVAETTDNDDDSFELLGILALQLHTGPPMKNQFRHIRLKRLPREREFTAQERLLAEANLLWRLGEREDAQQPLLRSWGVKFAAPSIGRAARDGAKSGDFPPGHLDLIKDFNTCREWNATGEGTTVYVRARAEKYDWNVPLFAKREGRDAMNFSLHGAEIDGETHFCFELWTDAGRQFVSFPASRVDIQQWHDLVGRYDGQKLALLCDGHVMAEVPAGGAIRPSQTIMLIGGEIEDWKITRRFAGQIETVALWQRALSDEEIRTAIGE